MPPEENADGQEKSEPATVRRRQKARQKGSVVRSKEINSAVILFFFLITAAIYGPMMMRTLMDFVRFMLGHFYQINLVSDNVLPFAVALGLFVAKVLAPFLLTLLVVGVVSNLAQFGWLWTTETIFQGIKNFSLNPTKMLKKLFNASSLVTLGINLLKLTILICVIWGTLRDELWRFPGLMELPLLDSFSYMTRLFFFLALRIVVMLILIAIADYFWERHKHEKSLKMTKIEVKDERKQLEGDPTIRAKIRGVMQKAAMERMMKNVPSADVVITNPVHLAVAIKYDRNTMSAPRVVAKGARLIAERIKEIARATSVPIVENKPLAQTIYKTVEVGEEVPPKLYQAIAEVLAYVYQLNKVKRERAAI